jgi:hypothetical protein
MISPGFFQADGGQITGFEALDDNVRRASHLAQQLRPLRVIQIELDAPLVKIGEEEDQALLRMGNVAEMRGHSLGGVTLGRLDFERLGAKVSEDLRAKRTRDALTEVEHLYIVKRSRRHHCAVTTNIDMNSTASVKQSAVSAA